MPRKAKKPGRSILYNIRLSPADLEAIEKKAKKADLTVSDFIRREVGLRVLRPPPAPSELPGELEENPGATALKRLGLTSAKPDEGEAA